MYLDTKMNKKYKRELLWTEIWKLILRILLSFFLAHEQTVFCTIKAQLNKTWKCGRQRAKTFKTIESLFSEIGTLLFYEAYTKNSRSSGY